MREILLIGLCTVRLCACFSQLLSVYELISEDRVALHMCLPCSYLD